MRQLLALTTTLLPLAFLACDRADTEDELAALERPNGGYDKSDEAPLFGDSTFGLTGETLADPSPAAGTDALTRDDVQRGEHLRALDRIALTILWGHREAVRDDTEWTDWSGRLSITGGTIAGVRTIRFDRRDHLLPRESRDSLAWISHTRPHHDGVQVALVLHPEAIERGSITFQTQPFQIELPLAELAHFDRVFDAGDEQVIIHAFRARPAECATGTVRGIWSEPNDDGIGHLRGRVLDEAGEVRGHLRGRYGTREDGRRVFFAKVIDRDGDFLGRVRGRWGEGEFRGHFEGRRGHHGHVRGRYLESTRPEPTTASPDPGDPSTTIHPDRFGGVFLGRWAEQCRDRPTTMPMEDMPADDLGDGAEPAEPAPGDNTPMVP